MAFTSDSIGRRARLAICEVFGKPPVTLPRVTTGWADVQYTEGRRQTKKRVDAHSVLRSYFIRMLVPDELVDAITTALDREAGETNLSARAELLLRTRRALDGWLDGSLSTSQALAAIRGHTCV